MTTEGRGCYLGERACLAGCTAVSFVCNEETRALFLLQKHDPLSPRTFEPGAKVFNACDLCGPCRPPNPVAFHSQAQHTAQYPQFGEAKRSSTPLGLRTDPQGKATTPQA